MIGVEGTERTERGEERAVSSFLLLHLLLLLLLAEVDVEYLYRLWFLQIPGGFGRFLIIVDLQAVDRDGVLARIG
ncbi:hypothetical protein PENTCL1PPCAC_9808, partial [Pristionchus entomophagus]